MSDPTQTQAVEALAARIYAQRDLLPSKRRDDHNSFKPDDALSIARAILTSDWLTANNAAQRRAGAEEAERERDQAVLARNSAMRQRDIEAAAKEANWKALGEWSIRAESAEADLARLREAVQHMYDAAAEAHADPDEDINGQWGDGYGTAYREVILDLRSVLAQSGERA
jgi:hypothetical protein